MPRDHSTTNVAHDLHARARAAVRLVRRATGAPYSLTAFVRDAFTNQLRTLADLYNNGKPIEPDEVPLEPGRLV